MPLAKWILGQYLRQAAEEKVSEAVAEKLARQSGAESGGYEPPGHCDVGVVCALAAEAGGLVDRLDHVVALRGEGFTVHAGRLHERSVMVARSGGGLAAARTATEALLVGHRPQWVLAIGFASGLADDLARGDFLLPDRLATEGRQDLTVDLKLSPEAGSGPRVHVGPLLSLEAIVAQPEQKRSLAAAHDALALDRDTFAIADMCRRAKIRFLAVRVISDGVDEPLPPDLERRLRRRSLAERAGAATGLIWSKPGGAKRLWQDQTAAWRAADALGQFVVGVIGQLPIEP